MVAPEPETPVILIADDNPQNVELLDAYLADIDCRIVIATDGEDTLRAVEEHRPDLVLLDVMMPRLSGFEVCRKLRANPATKDTLVLRMSDDEWDAVLDTNLTGSFRVARRAAKGMLRLRRGRIVFISSVVGLLGSAGQVNYAASKSGLVGMARSLARELGSRSITANVVAPGFIETDMTEELTDELKAKYKEQIPLGRMATADEVASSVVFLASEGAAYITGAVVPVDGGLGMGH